MDFAFLNEKPGVGRKGKKGRRHAGQAMLQRQVSNQGFLIKKCIVDASSEKQCGKVTSKQKFSEAIRVLISVITTHISMFVQKRRARLLSDHMSDFNLSVPYSLNRKNRWDLENTEEYALALAEQLEDSGDANNNFLRMAVGESEFQCCQAPGERLKSYHLVGGVEPGAAPTSYVARSNRGSTLANLVVPKGGKGASTKSSSRDENNNNISLAKSGRPESAVMMGSADWLDSPPKVNVEYLICKPHPKMYASKCFKGSRNGGVKSMRRAALELICGNSSGSLGNRYKSEQQRMDEDNIANNNAAEPPILLEDTGRTTRDLPTYTLADFLKESSPPPVFVKSPASSLAAAKRRTTITDSEIEVVQQ